MNVEHNILTLIKKSKKLEKELVGRIEKAEDRLSQLEAQLRRFTQKPEDGTPP